MKEEAKLRAFIALRLGSALEQQLGRLIEELRRPGDGVRWVDREKLHVTLFFLGEAVSAARLTRLCDELAAAAQKLAPFEVTARGLGGFPTMTRARVIWIGLDSPELVATARAVRAAAVRCAFTPERRPYAPHLTIGRVADPGRLRLPPGALQDSLDRVFGTARVCWFSLVESTLTPAGANYRELQRFELGPGLERAPADALVGPATGGPGCTEPQDRGGTR
ncbi:MAG: RNA 2',3'-cyclic phosphodiesterase [Deltaproteobacteria bacterium]|jgi:2'-5' RNA ligase|nr:RNA 2',3'-cyclic phosphodiesterase [Deltaproteobacteria bacterium]